MALGRTRAESLASVDVAWYQMEDPTNLMMITGVFIFDQPVDFERLKATLDVRFAQRFRRFRQRVVAKRSRFGRPTWEDDPNFDLSNHLYRVALPAPGDHAALQAMVSDLMSTALDFSRPLWHFHLIDGYDGRSVLLVRLHHAIADGIALVQVMLSMTDTDEEGTTSPPPPRKPQGWSPLAPVLRPARSALKLTRKTVDAAIRNSVSVARDPEHLVDLARVGADMALTTGRVLLMSSDPKTVYKGKLVVRKQAAWSDPIPLEEVKLIGRAVGGTVNDVLMSATAGAMRRYMEGRGEPVTDLNFRAVIPFNLRKPSRRIELGNKFGLVFLSMPIGVADPVDRLRELKQRMDALKDSTEPIVTFGVLALIGLFPDSLQDRIVEIFGKKSTLVLTNVPGPREQLFLAGAPIGEIMFWVPQSGRLGLGISILSYNDQVMVGVASDSSLVPDPEAIVAAFHLELEALRAEMRQRLMETARKFDIPLAEDVASQPNGNQGGGISAVQIDWAAISEAMRPAAPAYVPNGDDLTSIVGIGPAYAARLQSAGIDSFSQLAAASPDQLAELLAVPDWRRPDFESWLEQATALSGGSVGDRPQQ
ncbi:MAG: wax ester/triacylglycerol synthase family O-acyltransferase [Anaerolinea sp.]|nr:wax ester/triacylglycerol synthase family O-acyltransferase [Anaerolinea sp.]